MAQSLIIHIIDNNILILENLIPKSYFLSVYSSEFKWGKSYILVTACAEERTFQEHIMRDKETKQNKNINHKNEIEN